MMISIELMCINIIIFFKCAHMCFTYFWTEFTDSTQLGILACPFTFVWFLNLFSGFFILWYCSFPCTCSRCTPYSTDDSRHKRCPSFGRWCMMCIKGWLFWWLINRCPLWACFSTAVALTVCFIVKYYFLQNIIKYIILYQTFLYLFHAH
jgi:hypothetical protein